MQIDINHRGNGACPICKKYGKCSIHEAIKKGVHEQETKKTELEMELVIYSCSKFEEKF